MRPPGAPAVPRPPPSCSSGATPGRATAHSHGSQVPRALSTCRSCSRFLQHWGRDPHGPRGRHRRPRHNRILDSNNAQHAQNKCLHLFRRGRPSRHRRRFGVPDPSSPPWRHTIPAIYNERWQIELLFNAIKQNLKLKTFAGYGRGEHIMALSPAPRGYSARAVEW